LTGRLKMEVRSRKRAVRSVSIAHPFYSPTGVFLGTTTSVGVLYQNSLDEQSRKALEQAGRFSADFGLTLEVVDGSLGLLDRVRNRLGHHSVMDVLSIPPDRNC